MEINVWTKITAQNIAAAREALPCDQAQELIAPGPYYIILSDDNQESAAVTVFPRSGRFLAAYGSGSVGGDWRNGQTAWIADDGELIDMGPYDIPTLAIDRRETVAPDVKTARAKAGAAARWGATAAAVAALAERLDGTQLSDILADWVATQPEWVDAAIAERPLILRGLLNAFERQQVERFRRLGIV